jgi:hypothetical protein
LKTSHIKNSNSQHTQYEEAAALESKSVDKYLSKTERKIFDALANSISMKEAASKLGLEPQSLYNWKWKLLKRYKHRRGWINSVLAQARRNRLLKDLLSTKKPLEDVIEDLGEEEWQTIR